MAILGLDDLPTFVASGHFRIALPGTYVFNGTSAPSAWQLPSYGLTFFVRRGVAIFFVKNESTTVGAILPVTVADGTTIKVGVLAVSTLELYPGDEAVILFDGANFFAMVSQYAAAVQTASPLTGTTVTLNADPAEKILVLTPAGTIAALTIAFPADSSTMIGQSITIFSTQIITALTVNGATNIFNAPTSMTAGQKFTLQKMAANTWA